MGVDDFIDAFYAFDINSWANSLDSILHLLNYPVHLEYTCDWEEFLYERTEKVLYLGKADRRALSECQEIAVFNTDDLFRKLKIISVKLSGNPRLRNEKTYEIYKSFRKVFGRRFLFVVCFDREIAFVGTAVDQSKKSEVVISDWFGENTNPEIMSRILEIDCGLFSYDNFGRFYGDYLWAIARPYVKYRESKMFLLYECGFLATYESFAKDPEGDEIIPVTKVDQEETLRINSSYYPDLYGDDFFTDESETEEYSFEEFDEIDSEFEWTMLEMDLANEDGLDETDDVEEYDYENADEYDDLSGMNPEEMLDYIRAEDM